MFINRAVTAFFLLSILVPAFNCKGGMYATINIDGDIVEAPECTVNDNNLINIDFGNDVLINRIDGVNYKKTDLIYTMHCDNIISTALKLKIVAHSDPGFGVGLIGVGKEGLGLRLYNGSTPINTNVEIDFKYQEGTLPPVLSVVPVAEDKEKLTAGYFSGVATMQIYYQ